MKSTLKKAISVLIALTVIFGSFAFGFSDVDWSDFAVKALAYGGDCGENLTWTLNIETGELVISGTGDMKDYSDLRSPWHHLRHHIKNVTIYDGVTSIGNYAFQHCDYLTSIEIPYGVTSIGDYAFYPSCTDLTSLEIPDSVICIGGYAFCGTGLTSIEFPDSLTIIGESAFNFCNDLTGITIPVNVANIGIAAFSSCGSLTEIIVDSANAAYSSDEYGVLFNKDKTELVQYPVGNERTSYAIPDSVAKICCDAFYGCKNLTSVEIPDCVTNIDYGAFAFCQNLISVEMPDGVTNIGKGAFNYCRSLENVEIPCSVTSIGDLAFAWCTEFTSVEIPCNVTSIGDGALSYCSNLTNITVDSLNPIYSSDEYGVLFDKNKRELLQYPIGNTRTSYTIPDNVTIIRDAFRNSINLTSIEIPKSVTTISDYAFYICTGLTDVFYSGTEAEWNAITIGKYNDPLINATLHFNNAPEDKPTTEPTTTKPVEIPTTTKPAETEPSTTKPVEVPSTTKPVEIPTTTKPVVTEPSTTKPVEIPTTTKPTTKPTKPIETTKPTTAPTTKPETTTKPVVEEEIIKKPSTSTVKYGETLILHADFANIPEGAKIEWSVEGEGVTIKPSADGLICAVTSTATGDVTITAKYTDANGVEHVSEQEIKSNASFWQKIVSFFKNLFRMNRIIEQVIKF